MEKIEENNIKFIHASDLHIDSPLKGLDKYENAPVDMIRSATRKAFENLIELAIKENVDFIILSGDLVDGEWNNTQTILWLNNQFRKLEKYAIQIYTIKGNHDAQNNLSKFITLSENVHEFPNMPYTFIDSNNRYAIHGQSYPIREVSDNLAKMYPEPIEKVFNVGVLHTNLIGSTEHANYAPTTVNELIAKNYQYWALGHVHNASIINEYPHIVYPGNIQGRNIKETGEKGCYLVKVNEDYQIEIVFKPLHVVKWEKIEIESNQNDDIQMLLRKIKSAFIERTLKNKNILTAVRLIIYGSNNEYGKLASFKGVDDFRNFVLDIANSVSTPIWIEKVELDLKASVDKEKLKKSDTLLGDLLKLTAEFKNDTGFLKELISEDTLALKGKTAINIERIGKNLSDDKILKSYLDKAENILISYLGGSEN